MQSVPYALLFEELGLGEGEGKVRELEDIIIETIYMVRPLRAATRLV